jgi:hypothetical protein
LLAALPTCQPHHDDSKAHTQRVVQLQRLADETGLWLQAAVTAGCMQRIRQLLLVCRARHGEAWEKV